MKTILRRIVPGIILAFGLTLPVMGQTRIGTIDLRKVFDNYWKRQQAESALKEHGTELEKEFKSYVDDYTKSKDDYTKLLEAANDQTVTPEEREKRKKAAESKLLDIKTSENTMRTFEANAHDQLDMQRKRLRDTILGEIRTAVSAKAKASGYSMVIDSSAEGAAGTVMMLYNNGENDITDAILSQLNAGAPPPVSDDSAKTK
jgi:outer membrane protein